MDPSDHGQLADAARAYRVTVAFERRGHPDPVGPKAGKPPAGRWRRGRRHLGLPVDLGFDGVHAVVLEAVQAVFEVLDLDAAVLASLDQLGGGGAGG